MLAFDKYAVAAETSQNDTTKAKSFFVSEYIFLNAELQVA